MDCSDEAAMGMRKVALVTGASGGLGARLAVEFARARYRVGVHYQTGRNRVLRTAAVISRGGGEALCFRADVRNGEEVGAMVHEIVSRWGRLDVLVNNAGVTHESLLISTDEEEWDRIIGTNLTGAFNCARAAAGHMIAQRSGHIISISSILAIRGERGAAAYSASKAGLIGLSRSLARELGPYGICVNVVMPGFMLTRMTRPLSRGVIEEARLSSVLGRLSDAGETARFVVRLAEMDGVSGQLFNLDGRICRWA